ncbi:sensor histidine kinase [Hymenobacter cellulosivorans]|uniref:Histidine kinase n=1 Tax=Hymenobacter cellulosivorans TaxID=2932249 RepID=A0ABY4F465_9BACT|nr:histidine kinase [Hymenobacter cellulosivorans]UOQ51274.1 histidine kinase [Hymenobacter cellulosivorans]
MPLKNKLNSFIWTFFTLGVLLQLSFSKELPLSSALLCTGCIVLTLRIYIQSISAKLVQGFTARLNSVQLAALIIASCFVVALILSLENYAVIKLTMQETAAADILKNSTPVFFGFFIVSGFVSGLSYLLERYKDSLIKDKELEVLKRKALEMELSLLRNQLSPHFTFNVLNNLQFLIRKDQQKALRLLSTYSRILRYYIYESQKEFITVDDEVSFLKQYFDLEINRYVDKLQIVSEWNVIENSFQITPFILSAFVENAFKHVLPAQMGEYFIRQTCTLTEQGNLIFEITNTFDKHVRAGKPQGVGLKHVRERLSLAYPNRYALAVQEIGDIFCVKLELRLYL